ncbi:zinc finger, CCHC-type containing protein [Tanacetum coccineum]
MGWSSRSMTVMGGESGGVSNFVINILNLGVTTKSSSMNVRRLIGRQRSPAGRQRVKLVSSRVMPGGTKDLLGHVHFKRMQDMYKDGLIPTFDIDTEKCKTCILTKITEKPFQNVKHETEVLELIYSDLCDLHVIPLLRNKKYIVKFIDDVSRTDKGGEYIDTLYFQSVDIIHEMTALYTPQQNGISKKKNRVLKDVVNFMLSYSRLSEGFWGKAMAVVRLPDPKLKNLGERDIECIFVGYAEHSKAFTFLSVPIPSQRSLINRTEEFGGSVVSKEVTKVVQQPEPELKKSKSNRNPKNFRPEFQLYLIERRREAINDEINSIMGNNTWVLVDLPPRCKWIFKRKLKVDGTIEKFMARLEGWFIQGFKQKSGIDYFDTYALVARISTIRLLIAMTSIHNLIIHQIDVKIIFLNRKNGEEKLSQYPHICLIVSMLF